MKERIAFVDYIRVVACLMVMVVHNPIASRLACHSRHRSAQFHLLRDNDKAVVVSPWKQIHRWMLKEKQNLEDAVMPSSGFCFVICFSNQFFIQLGLSFLKVLMWRSRRSEKISEMVMRMPVSSTSPNSSLMAVPKNFIVGEMFM